jgi:hypothetical protein
MATPAMTALVASVYVVGDDHDDVCLFCIHCRRMAAHLDARDPLTKGMDDVRKHAADCPKWPALDRRLSA